MNQIRKKQRAKTIKNRTAKRATSAIVTIITTASSVKKKETQFHIEKKMGCVGRV